MAKNFDLPTIEAAKIEQTFDQGGLPRAIYADKAGERSGLQSYVDVLKDPSSSIAFRNPLQAQDRRIRDGRLIHCCLPDQDDSLDDSAPLGGGLICEAMSMAIKH